MGNRYAIMRHGKSKFKTFAEIAKADKHNSREVDVFNADPKKQTFRLIGKGRKTEDILKERLRQYGIKPRKNAALAMEYVLSFSPDVAKDINIKEWAEANAHFMREEHGVGLLTLDLHLDESTPHIHCICAPLIEKEVRGKLQMRLSGIDFWKGKSKLSARQTRYAKAMANFGLERGVVGSTAHHKTIKTFYKELQNNIKKIKLDSAKYLKSNNDSLISDEPPGLLDIKLLKSNYRELQNKLKSTFNLLSKATGAITNLTNRNKLLSSEVERLKLDINFRDQKLHHNGFNKVEYALNVSNERIENLKQNMFEQKVKYKNQIDEKNNEIQRLNQGIKTRDNMLDKYEYQRGLENT